MEAHGYSANSSSSGGERRGVVRGDLEGQMGTSGIGSGSGRCWRISEASLGQASVGCGPNSPSCLLHCQVTSPPAL